MRSTPSARPSRSSESRSENHDGQAAQHQHEQIAKLHGSAAALHRLTQKIHRRPLDHSKAAAVQQMNDDRTCGGNQAGDRKRAGKELEHGR